MDIRNLFQTAFINRAVERKPQTLVAVAKRAEAVIQRALDAGVTIDDGNVIDLLADNDAHTSLIDLRAALVISKFSGRWSKAERGIRVFTQSNTAELAEFLHTQGV